MSHFRDISFKPGELIFTSGDLADKVYFIKSGAVEVLTDLGVPIAKVSTGQSFGEQAFLKGGVRGATVKALDVVDCVVITTEEANALLYGASPLLVPVFEALLLQQNMSNELKKSRAAGPEAQ